MKERIAAGEVTGEVSSAVLTLVSTVRSEVQMLGEMVDGEMLGGSEASPPKVKPLKVDRFAEFVDALRANKDSFLMEPTQYAFVEWLEDTATVAKDIEDAKRAAAGDTRVAAWHEQLVASGAITEETFWNHYAYKVAAFKIDEAKRAALFNDEGADEEEEDLSLDWGGDLDDEEAWPEDAQDEGAGAEAGVGTPDGEAEAGGGEEPAVPSSELLDGGVDDDDNEDGLAWGAAADDDDDDMDDGAKGAAPPAAAPEPVAAEDVVGAEGGHDGADAEASEAPPARNGDGDHSSDGASTQNGDTAHGNSCANGEVAGSVDATPAAEAKVGPQPDTDTQPAGDAPAQPAELNGGPEEAGKGSEEEEDWGSWE